MAGTDAGRPTGADFEEPARAGEDAPARAAFLATGDERHTHALVRAALLTSARHWTRVRAELLDLFVLPEARTALTTSPLSTRGPRRGRPRPGGVVG